MRVKRNLNSPLLMGKVESVDILVLPVVCVRAMEGLGSSFDKGRSTVSKVLEVAGSVPTGL